MEKFIKPRLLTPRGQSHKKFWQAVGLCALTAAIFFLPFYILDGGFFHYAGDFNSQQISFYRYMNGFVKGAGYPDSAFAGAPRNTFSWATDLGSGVMNAYSFYLYGSPFFWLSVLLPQSWLPYMMVPLLVLKFGVAGGGAFLYLRRYVKNENYAVLGACLYALSGFAVYNVFFNHFVDVVALFPYLLWALDEAIYENRHGLFAFWVAVNLLNNYFFFVGQVVFLAIYFVCKVASGEVRLTGRLFGHLALESLLGCGMVGTETGAPNAEYKFCPECRSDAALATFIKNFKPVVRCAEQYGVTIAIEPVVRHIVYDARRARTVLDEIGSPNLQILLDPVNLLNMENVDQREEVFAETIELLGKDVAMIHFKDFLLQDADGQLAATGAGQGGMGDYRTILRFAKEQKPYVFATLENTTPENAVQCLQYLQKQYDEC